MPSLKEGKKKDGYSGEGVCGKDLESLRGIRGKKKNLAK